MAPMQINAQPDPFDQMIGRLDRMLSEFLLAAGGQLDEVDRQTVKHHADDLIGVGRAALAKLAQPELPVGKAPNAEQSKDLAERLARREIGKFTHEIVVDAYVMVSDDDLLCVALRDAADGAERSMGSNGLGDSFISPQLVRNAATTIDGLRDALARARHQLARRVWSDAWMRIIGIQIDYNTDAALDEALRALGKGYIAGSTFADLDGLVAWLDANHPRARPASISLNEFKRSARTCDAKEKNVATIDARPEPAPPQPEGSWADIPPNARVEVAGYRFKCQTCGRDVDVTSVDCADCAKQDQAAELRARLGEAERELTSALESAASSARDLLDVSAKYDEARGNFSRFAWVLLLGNKSNPRAILSSRDVLDAMLRGLGKPSGYADDADAVAWLGQHYRGHRDAAIAMIEGASESAGIADVVAEQLHVFSNRLRAVTGLNEPIRELRVHHVVGLALGLVPPNQTAVPGAPASASRRTIDRVLVASAEAPLAACTGCGGRGAVSSGPLMRDPCIECGGTGKVVAP